MSAQRTAGVVLTGGASKRMGVDKATLVVGGKPMAVRVADAMWEARCQPVECQGGNAATIGAYGLDVVPDRRPGDGPVTAILDALERHDGSDVVVAACDLVDLDCETIQALILAGATNPHADTVVAATAGEWHLVSWWRGGTARPLAELVADGVTAYREALSRLTTIEVEVEPRTIRNVNTPTDVDAGR